MDTQKALESLARNNNRPLTSLAEISTRYSQSGKVACCGGLMTRLITESADDSTVLLRDNTGSCYCALHGDITSRYPDVLTTGALLLFTDVTVLVLSSKVPPLLVACLQNLSGLALPNEDLTAAAAAAAATVATETDLRDSMPDPAAAAAARATETDMFNFDSAASDTRFDGDASTRGREAASEGEGHDGRPALRERVHGPPSLRRDQRSEGNTTERGFGEIRTDRRRGNATSAAADLGVARATPEPKRARAEESADLFPTNNNSGTINGVHGEDDDEDADCLELVDDF